MDINFIDANDRKQTPTKVYWIESSYRFDAPIRLGGFFTSPSDVSKRLEEIYSNNEYGHNWVEEGYVLKYDQLTGIPYLDHHEKWVVIKFSELN